MLIHARRFRCLAASLGLLKRGFISFSVWATGPEVSREFSAKVGSRRVKFESTIFLYLFCDLLFLISYERSERAAPRDLERRQCSFEIKCQMFWQMSVSIRIHIEESFRGARRQTLLSPAGGAQEVISFPLCGWGPWEKTEAPTNGIDLSRRASLWPLWSRALWRTLPRLESDQNGRTLCTTAVILSMKLSTNSRVQWAIDSFSSAAHKSAIPNCGTKMPLPRQTFPSIHPSNHLWAIKWDDQISLSNIPNRLYQWRWPVVYFRVYAGVQSIPTYFFLDSIVYTHFSIPSDAHHGVSSFAEWSCLKKELAWIKSKPTSSTVTDFFIIAPIIRVAFMSAGLWALVAVKCDTTKKGHPVHWAARIWTEWHTICKNRSGWAPCEAPPFVCRHKADK